MISKNKFRLHAWVYVIENAFELLLRASIHFFRLTWGVVEFFHEYSACHDRSNRSLLLALLFLSLFLHSYRRIVLFAARLDRRQLKRSYRLLQRKAALYSRFSVKGSISRLFRNKSRANREIHRGANIKQYYLANVPSARTFLKSITWNFYRRFSMDHGSIIFFLIFSLSWIHSKYFLFSIFLF